MSLPVLNWDKWNCMDKRHHNFEMDAPMLLKLWKWLVDAYNNIYKWFIKRNNNNNKKGEAPPQSSLKSLWHSLYKNGNIYSPVSITSIASSVQCYLQENRWPISILIYDFRNPTCDLRKSLDAKINPLMDTSVIWCEANLFLKKKSLKNQPLQLWVRQL